MLMSDIQNISEELKKKKKSSGKIPPPHTKDYVFILYKTLVGDLTGDCFLTKKLANVNLWQRLGSELLLFYVLHHCSHI